ncbi:MAG: flippase [Clostridiales bacterium]|nr:flippase [Clostridiales bacterium]
MNVILSMSAFIFPMITFPYVSRVLMPDGMGRVSFATSVITYFAMVAQLGIPTYGIRACARVRDDREQLTKTVQEILVICFSVTAVTYILFLISLAVVPRFARDRALLLIMSVTFFFNAIGTEWLYKALEHYTYITVRSVLFKLIAVAAMFLLVHSPEDYMIYGGISIFAASASNVLNFINVRKYISLRPVRSYDIRRHFRPIAVFFAMECAATVYTNLDTVMLGFMTSDAVVGYYSVAVKVKIILVCVVTSLGTVLLPRVSYYYEHGQLEEFRRLTGRAIEFIMVFAAPMTVFFTIFAYDCIMFLAGNAYGPSVLPMQIIMPTLLLIGLTNIMGIQILVPMGREKVVLHSELAGVVTDLILNLLLIPKMGAVGAAVGTLAAEAVVWIVQIAALRDSILYAYRRIRYFPLVLALLLAAAASFRIPCIGMFSLMSIAVGGVVFFGIYLFVLTIAKEPLIIDIERQLLSRISSARNRKY